MYIYKMYNNFYTEFNELYIYIYILGCAMREC